MGHTHDTAPDRSHGGSAQGWAWHLLDVLMIACAVIVLGLWAEALWRARKQRIRYSLTPEGQAAATPAPQVGVPGQPPLVDLDALSRVFAEDQAEAGRRTTVAVEHGGQTHQVDATEWLRRKAQPDT